MSCHLPSLTSFEEGKARTLFISKAGRESKLFKAGTSQRPMGSRGLMLSERKAPVGKLGVGWGLPTKLVTLP